jgi:hypothetical protein
MDIKDNNKKQRHFCVFNSQSRPLNMRAIRITSRSKKLKAAPTPLVNGGSLCPDDDESRGELAANASRILMKALWVARLARPDLLKPITALARHVQSWSVNCDKQLYRLICYMYSTPNLKLTGHVGDSLDKVHLRLYVDADFAVQYGERVYFLDDARAVPPSEVRVHFSFNHELRAFRDS